MKKYLFIILISSFLLGGCDYSRDFVEWLSGTKTNIVILANKPTILNTNPVTFKTNDKVKIVGNMTQVCLSLRGNLPSDSSNIMDDEYKRLLKGISISGIVKTTKGKEIPIKNPTRSWAKFGIIKKDDELAACLRVNYSKENIPIDTIVSSIQLVASGKLEVQGIYWESTNQWDWNP